MKKVGCLAVSLALGLILSSQCIAAQLPLWLLTYNTGAGEAYIYAQPDGVRIEYLRHLVLLTTSPKWQPAYFSTRVKRIYDMPPGIKELARKSNNLAKYDFRLQRPSGPEENWYGLKVTRKTLQIKEYQSSGISGLQTDNAVPARSIDLYETKSLALPPGAVASAQMYFSERYKLATDGIPLGLRVIDDSGKLLWIFKLKNASKTKGDLALFERPKNLALAKTLSAVYLDDSQRSAIRDIAEDLGIAELPKKSSSKGLVKESGSSTRRP